MKCTADPACIFPATVLGVCIYHEHELEYSMSMHDVSNVHKAYSFLGEFIVQKVTGFTVRSIDGGDVWTRKLHFGLDRTGRFKKGRSIMDGKLEPSQSDQTIASNPVTPTITVELALPQRRHLPLERESINHKFSVGNRRCYIVVGLYPDGTPGELFIKLGKIGEEGHGFAEAWAQLFSVALQHGFKLEYLINKFKHMKFEPAGVTDSQNKDLKFADSIIDYVVRWMELRFLKGRPRSDGGQFISTSGNA